MSYKYLFQTACKALGFFFIIQALLAVEQLIMFILGLGYYYERESIGIMFGQYFLDIMFNSLVAWLLITKSQIIGDRLIKEGQSPIQLSISKPELVEVIVISIGLLFLINAFSKVLSEFLQYLYFNDYSRSEKNLFWDQGNRTSEMVFAVVKLLVGFLVMTNGRTIAKKLTAIGVKQDNPGSNDSTQPM